MFMELFVSFNSSSLFLELLSNYTQATDRNLIKILKIKDSTQNKLKLPSLPFLVAKDGTILSGDVEISESISKISGRYEALFGRSGEEASSNLSLFNHLVDLISKGGNELISFLNKHLQNNTFMNGFSITICDLFAFANAILHVTQLTDQEKLDHCNLVRWVDHIQNLEGIKHQINELKLKMNLPYAPLILKTEVEIAKAGKDKKENKKEEKKATREK